MRVIGGERRGRRLAAPDTPAVRPTSDRVREAIFDILFSLGGVEGLQVLDLFAGTGALGIEALSRGAATATFVERDPLALRFLAENLISVGLDDADASGDATVVRAEVVSWLRHTVARYDLAFVDPPYAFTEWATLVELLPCDLAVLESSAPPELPESWETLKSKRYGGTIVTVAQPVEAAQKGNS